MFFLVGTFHFVKNFDFFFGFQKHFFEKFSFFTFQKSRKCSITLKPLLNFEFSKCKIFFGLFFWLFFGFFILVKKVKKIVHFLKNKQKQIEIFNFEKLKFCVLFFSFLLIFFHVFFVFSVFFSFFHMF